MCSKDFLDEIQRKFADAFKSQNPELFDVVFDFDGKKLYADRLRLSLASTTFESMLSDRWTSKNDAIKIESYKHEDFKELLSFLYSGKCKLNDENIFDMLDISEFYQIQHLKELCVQYLSKIKFTLSNIFQLLELSNKYSLVEMRKPIHDFISENFTAFVKSEEFMNVDKSIVKEFVAGNIIVKPENIFQAVYEWAEHQAAVKQQELPEDENFNLNDSIKNEITEFLSFIEFKRMDLSFLTQYVVKKGFLFSYDELSDILECVRSSVKVTVTNLHGNSICGKISHRDVDIIEAIKTLKNCESDNHAGVLIYWHKKCEIPTALSSLEKRDGVKWYLISFNGYIGVERHCNIHVDDCLIAEMFSETDFVVTPKCKIETD